MGEDHEIRPNAVPEQAKKEQINKATNGIIAATSDLAAVIKKTHLTQIF